MTSSGADPITIEVIRNTLPAIANEMSLDLQRASYNMMIYEVRDYCCALLNPKGELLSQNLGGLSHFVADLGVVIRDGVDRYGIDGFSRGDVIITNHQRVGGQHLNNVSAYTPVFHRNILRGFAIVRAHWVDIGGLSTGFGSDAAYDPWLEGLQLDQLKIHEAGRADEKLLRLIKDNVRMPDRSMGDLRAQIASCHLAGRDLVELYERYGSETIEDAIEQIFAQTEERCRQAVAGISDGVYEAESIHPGDRLGTQPVEIKVRVTVAGSDMTIDLSGCSQERPKQAINSRTHAGAMIPYKIITGPNEPLNEGSFRACRAIIPEGNIMMARFPTPMTGWSYIIPTVAETVLLALAPAMPDRIPAGNGGSGRGITFFGSDEHGRRFISTSIEGRGWGGRPSQDGPSASVSIHQGDTCNAPIELLELKVPFVVEQRSLVQDSGGPGKFRGGLGVCVGIRTLTEGRLNMGQATKTELPMANLWGGMSGTSTTSKLKLPEDAGFKSDVVLDRFAVPAGTIASTNSPGGCGWGDPLERDPAAVLVDLVEELISRSSADEQYGVVTDDHLGLDEEATAQRRKELRNLREPSPREAADQRQSQGPSTF